MISSCSESSFFSRTPETEEASANRHRNTDAHRLSGKKELARAARNIGGGQSMVSVITMDSVANPGINTESQDIAIVKADSVIPTVD